MGVQQTLTSASNTPEVDLKSNEDVLASNKSAASNDQPSEKKEDEETEVSPVAPAPGPGDFPDGGFAAWSVAVGVSRFTISSSVQIF